MHPSTGPVVFLAHLLVTVAVGVREPTDGVATRTRVTEDEDAPPVVGDSDESSIAGDGTDATGSEATPNVSESWSLKGRLDVYNPYRLTRLWATRRQAALDETCRRDVATFLRALGAGDTWAEKMVDASGGYSSGLYWGSHIWTGSQSLCSWTDAQAGSNLPSFSAAATSKAPFHLGFYKLNVNITLREDQSTLASRTVLLGVCLPYSCSGQDVSHIVLSTVNTHLVILNITRVRTPHHHYYIADDLTFWILVGVTAIVSLLVTAGTLVDLFNVDYKGDQENSAKGVMSRILTSFSVCKNCRAICNMNPVSGSFPTIHGLRVFSITWVILGHTSNDLYTYMDNPMNREVFETRVMFRVILRGVYSVDTFFLISGLLLAFLHLRETEKRKRAQSLAASAKNVCLALLYRFVRLTVPYMYVLGVLEVLMKWFHANAVLDVPTLDHENCPNYWWRNVLYINTFFPVDQMCMLWSWYLSNDTLFYIIGIILLQLVGRFLKVTTLLLVVLMVSSWLTTSYIAFVLDYQPLSNDPLASFDEIYDKPWTRLGPYLVGLIVGWYLYKAKSEIRMNNLVVIFGWILALSCMACLVFGLHQDHLGPKTSAAYTSLSHTAWALCIAWIVVASTTEHGGYINTILGAPILYPLSRLTYCAYLIHPIFIRVIAMSADGPFHIEPAFLFLIFTGQLLCSFVLSFLLSLFLELPMVSLMKLELLPTKKWSDFDGMSRKSNIKVPHRTCSP